jgi:UDP-3-O-[3-hydroxymyristoyl] glucosamine N-acyltransferase
MKNVIIYPNAKLGKNVYLKPFCVIGGDGFEFHRGNEGDMIKLEHTKGVVIGDNVEVGSFTTVVRGFDRNTVIGSGSKLDDHIHYGHNVVCGKHCGFAAGTIIGGTVTIGHHTFFGINVMVKPQVRIGNYCLVGMGAVVTKDLPSYSVVAGNPARIIKDNRDYWKKLHRKS